MDDWNDLKLTLAIARAGSLSGAADALRLDHSTVFRRLRALETRLGAALFERSKAGRYQPTEAGARAAAAAERIEAETQALDRAITGRDQRLSGRLRVTCSETLAFALLTPELARLRALHPGLLVELALDNRPLSLARREADVALRALRPIEADLWGRKLADIAWSLYAAPEHPPLERLEALAGRPLIGWGEDATGVRAARWLARAAPAESVVFRSSSLIGQFQAAKAGMGLAALPCYLGDPEPGLRRALAAPIPDLATELWIVTHTELKTTARIRAFFEVIGEGLSRRRDLMAGAPLG